MSSECQELVAGNSAFAWKLYHSLASQSESNLFFAPQSVSTALAMTYAGASGETAREMAQALEFTLPPEALHAAFAELSQRERLPQDGSKVVLRTGNRLWAQRGFALQPAFLEVTRNRYGAGVGVVDFAAATETARSQINQWIEQQTEGKIAELIPTGMINALTRLVLTNAVYFKGDWVQPFPAGATSDGPFHLVGPETVTVPLMRLNTRLRLAGGEGFQALELPYGGDTLSMVVLLPDDQDGLALLERALTPETLDATLQGLRPAQVDVTFPKLDLTSQFQLSALLARLGMPQAFSAAQADFSGMTGSRDLYISAVVHEATVTLDEKGTEAAAATGVAMAMRSSAVPRPPIVFKADHPFVFLIRHNQTGSILFLGRVMNPAK